MCKQEPALFIPMRVEALVIDEKVTEQNRPVQDQGRYLAGDGKWSPASSNLSATAATFSQVGPKLFFGAQPKYSRKIKQADQLVLAENAKERASAKDHGVYLHWVLPQALRRSYIAGQLQLPNLPDQWLIVRFARHGRNQRRHSVTATFLDSSILLEDGTPNLIHLETTPQGSQYRARRTGKATPLQDLKDHVYHGVPRTKINAHGNEHTGSPWFTAFVADNRRCLSYFDPLTDLAQGQLLPTDLGLSYLVFGWYGDETQSPLKQVAQWVKTPPGFSIDATAAGELRSGPLPKHLLRAFEAKGHQLPPQVQLETEEEKGYWRVTTQEGIGLYRLSAETDKLRVEPLTSARILAAMQWQYSGQVPDDLWQSPCFFHGMSTHIHYWQNTTYKGPLLGYPGAPSAHGGFRFERPPLRIGMGHSAEDALIALTAGRQDENDKNPALWKALEAVTHGHSESILQGWQPGPREEAAHQSGFRSLEAGRRWQITAETGSTSSNPGQPQTLGGTPAPQPDARALEQLSQLNAAQAEADRLGRHIAALQQELYLSWWNITRLGRLGEDRLVIGQAKDRYRSLSRRIEENRKALVSPKDLVLKLSHNLSTHLQAQGLQLECAADSRFWYAADPVILIQNYGQNQRHADKTTTVRSSTEMVHQMQGSWRGTKLSLMDPWDLKATLDLVHRRLPQIKAPFEHILSEAELVERGCSALFIASRPQKMTDAQDWQQWIQGLKMAIQNPNDRTAPGQLLFSDTQQNLIPTSNLATPWTQQPWSPLFLDWEIEWKPTGPDLCGDKAQWTPGTHDFLPKETSGNESYTLRGRALITGVNPQFFMQPLNQLRDLLSRRKDPPNKQGSQSEAEVAAILQRYLPLWDLTLEEIAQGGLLGQAMGGLGQHFQGGDSNFPRIKPNKNAPWQAMDGFSDGEVSALLLSPNTQPGQPRHRAPMAAPRARLRGNDAIPPFPLRAGALCLKNLWLIDDFGQWADLLGGSTAGRSSGLAVHPRLRMPNDPLGNLIALPPRLVQPARLAFHFRRSAKDQPVTYPGGENPIRGWFFYNPMDKAFSFCAANGRSLGNLHLNQQLTTTVWERDPQSGAPSHPQHIEDPVLREFVMGLMQETENEEPRIQALKSLTDRALANIRTRGQGPGHRLGIRPLALVSATAGLEGYGPDDLNDNDARDLLRLQIPLEIGNPADPEDGLIGYFLHNRFDQLFHPRHQNTGQSPYLKPDDGHHLFVSFKNPTSLTLVVDPFCTIEARTRILPTKRRILSPALVNLSAEKLEASFHAGPLLFAGKQPCFPLPSDLPGTWSFCNQANAMSLAQITSQQVFPTEPIHALSGRLRLTPQTQS